MRPIMRRWSLPRLPTSPEGVNPDRKDDDEPGYDSNVFKRDIRHVQSILDYPHQHQTTYHAYYVTTAAIYTYPPHDRGRNREEECSGRYCNTSDPKLTHQDKSRQPRKEPGERKG